MNNQDSEKVWYICDPKKNTHCPKTVCVHNSNAEFQLCDKTSKIEYAADATPVQLTE